jgi:hypothetical protein
LLVSARLSLLLALSSAWGVKESLFLAGGALWLLPLVGYVLAWQQALAVGVVNALARNLGLRGWLPVFAAVVGFVLWVAASPLHGDPFSGEAFRLGLIGAVASAVSAWVANRLLRRWP